VNNVMTTVRNDGEERDTLVIYISDNGFQWREHGDARLEAALDPTVTPSQPMGLGTSTKAKPYTDSIKVPMFMRWPGNPSVHRGFVDSRMVGNVDMAPTAMKVAGISTDSSAGDPVMDGHPLLDRSARTRMLTEGWSIGVAPPPWASIRTNDYHYIEYYKADVDDPATSGDESKQVIFREFYNLQTDPFELANVYGPDDGDLTNDPQSNPPAATLSAMLAADRSCGGSNCP
jgi:arylsulfatase A-like enzyme